MPIQIADKKRFFLFVGTIIVLLAILVFLGVRLFNRDMGKEELPETPAVYEAITMITDETSGEAEGGKDNSLKKGDVIAVFPEGHPWSETEETSYLILKLRLKKEEADKLLESVTRELEGGEEEREFGSRQEIIQARKYRLKIESLGFDLQKFWENPVQPYFDQVFDSSLIEEKT